MFDPDAKTESQKMADTRAMLENIWTENENEEHYDVDELVESWINGNRKFVVENVMGNPVLMLQVFQQLSASDQNVFIRLVDR